MGVVRAAVTFESVTGLSADRIVHDFWFRWDGPTGPADSDLEDLSNLLVSFYNDVTAGANEKVAYGLSHEISRANGAAQVRNYVYTNLGAPSGSPQLVLPFQLAAGAATAASLPGEVACCLSVNADLTGVQVEVGNTRPQSRRRGRTYIGPLNAYWCSLGPGVSGVQRPNAFASDDARKSYKVLVEAAKNIMALNAGLFASVYSPTDQAVRNVIQCSTDDAFDTQRRRGTRPTAKSVLAVDLS